MMSTPGVSDHAADADYAELVRSITGGLATQVVRTFAALAIPDILADGPLSAAELAAATHTNPDALRRLLRGGVALGLAATTAQDTFANTPRARLLRASTPGSLHGWAVIMGSPGAWKPWGNFVEAITTGEPQTTSTLGMGYFAHLAQSPAEGVAFMQGMGGISDAIAETAAALIAPSSARIVADIGGASGAFVHALLRRHADLRGIVLERANVVDGANAASSQAGLRERVHVIAGDFLTGVPEADLYLLKWILHDWNDADCTAILANCRRAMRPNGRVVILELQLGEIDDPGLASLMDLNMLVVLNGRERTRRDYDALLEAADLRIVRVTRVDAPLGPWSLIEAEAR